jgi:hypothetical protein
LNIGFFPFPTAKSPDWPPGGKTSIFQWRNLVEYERDACMKFFYFIQQLQFWFDFRLAIRK